MTEIDFLYLALILMAVCLAATLGMVFMLWRKHNWLHTELHWTRQELLLLGEATGHVFVPNIERIHARAKNG